MLWGVAAGLVSVAVAWIPVTIAYILLLIDPTDVTIGTIWLVSSLISIDGPMIGYILGIVIILIGYFEPVNSGMVYRSELQFWLGMAMGIMITVFFITYQVAFLPGIRVWHNELIGIDTTVTVEEDGTTSSGGSSFDGTTTITFTKDDGEFFTF